MKTNLYALFWLCKFAVAVMRPAPRSSHILHPGHQPITLPDGLRHHQSRDRGLHQGVWRRRAVRGIRVNAVAPGPIWTPLIPATCHPRVREFGKDSRSAGRASRRTRARVRVLRSPEIQLHHVKSSESPVHTVHIVPHATGVPRGSARVVGSRPVSPPNGWRRLRGCSGLLRRLCAGRPRRGWRARQPHHRPAPPRRPCAPTRGAGVTALRGSAATASSSASPSMPARRRPVRQEERSGGPVTWTPNTVKSSWSSCAVPCCSRRRPPRSLTGGSEDHDDDHVFSSVVARLPWVRREFQAVWLRVGAGPRPVAVVVHSPVRPVERHDRDSTVLDTNRRRCVPQSAGPPLKGSSVCKPSARPSIQMSG